MAAKRFQIRGSALIDKVIISAQAKKALQGIVLKIDDNALQKSLSAVNQSLSSLRKNVGFLGTKGFGAQFQQTAAGIQTTTSAMNTLGKATKKQRNLFIEVIEKASAFRVSTIFINNFINALSGAVSFTIAFDKQLRNINKLLGVNDSELRGLGTSLLDVAGQYNLTAESAAEAFKTIVQLGLSGANATEQIAQGMQILAIAGTIAQSSTLNVTDAIELLIAVSKQFNKSIGESSAIVSKLSALEDASAVDAKDLFEIFKRAGTSIAQTFQDIDRGLGVFAALQERTRVGGAVVGTFAKTLISRLSGANKDVISTFKSLGIAIEDTTGRLRDPIDLLTELKSKVNALSDEDAGSVIGKIFGVRQAELGRATLETLGSGANIGRAEELSQASKTQSDRQLVKALEDTKSISFEFNKLKNNALKFVNEITDEQILPFLTSVGKSISVIIGLLSDAKEGFGSLLKVGGLALLTGLANTGLKGLTGSFANLLSGGINKGINTQQQTQQLGGIPNLKTHNKSLVFNPNNLSSRQVPSPKGVFNPYFNRLQQQPPSIGQNAIGGLNKVFAPFSLSSLALAGTLELLNSQFKVFTGRAGELFGTFTTATSLLGPVAGLIVTGANALIKSIGDIVERNKVLRGDISATSDYFRILASKETNTDTNKDLQDVIKNLDKRSFVNKLVNETNNVAGLDNQGGGDFSTETQDLLKRFAQQFGNIANNLADANFANVGTKDFDKTIREEVSRKLRFFEQVIPGSVEALAGTKKSGIKFAGVAQTDFFRQQIGEFSPELKQAVEDAFKARPGELLNLTDIFIDAVTQKASRIKDEQSRERSKELIDSREIIDSKLKELKAIEELTSATIEAQQAELELFAARRGAGDIDYIKEELKLKELARTAKISILEEEYRLEEERARKRYELTRQSTEQDIADISNRLYYLRNLGVESQQVNDEIATLTKRLNSIKDIKAYEPDKEIAEKERALNVERQKNLALRLQDEKKLFEVIQSNNKKQREDAISLTNVMLGVSNAQSNLIAEFSNLSAFDKLREEFKQATAASVIRLTSLKQEVEVLKSGQKEIIETRKRAIQQEIDAIDKGVRVRDANSILAGGKKKGITGEEANRKTLLKEQLDSLNLEDAFSGQKIKDALKAVEEQELKIQEERLNYLAKLLKAEKDLNKERLSGAVNLIKLARGLKDSVKSTFEAQKSFTDAIRNKIDEAAQNIKDKRNSLSDALSSLADARRALFDTFSESASVFAQYDLAIAKASVAAEKLLGNFFGVRDEAEALVSVYDAVIQSAQTAGASEKTLADLRSQAAKEQLDLYQRLLDEQRSRAERFFTSSAEDRVNFVEGISAVQSIIGRFGGNIENFRGLSEPQLNEFGASLISLPQELRQNIVSALELLPDGVSIAGLSKDQIKEVLQGASLGESSALGIESLSDTILTVADLLRQSETTNVSSLIEQQKQTGQALAAVNAAKEQVLFAKAQLEQAKTDAIKTQDAIRFVANTVGGQVSEYRAEFAAEAERIASSDASALEKQNQLVNLMTEFNGKISEILSSTGSKISSINLGDQVGTNVGESIPSVMLQEARPIFDQLGQTIKQTNDELKQEIIGLKGVISNDFIRDLNANTVALRSIGEQLTTRSSENLSQLKAEINIDNEQTINIKGAQDITSSVIRALEERGFVKNEQIRDIEATLEQIMTTLVNERLLKGSNILR